MSNVREMLNVIMDDLKDADMLMDYAFSADTADAANWFKNHAKRRLDALPSDYEWMASRTGLKERVNNGDEFAMALEHHLKEQMSALSHRYNEI